MIEIDYDRLELTIGYRFQDRSLLTRAITHRSFGALNNERLEFLGDALLNFVISADLYQRVPEATEGQLSRMRASLVKKETLADVARELKLGDVVIMGAGELKSGGFRRDSILSDTVEAVIGAILLEAGAEVAGAVLLGWFDQRLNNMDLTTEQKDAKTRLQELLQSKQGNLPRYEIVQAHGEAHNQTFLVEVFVDLLDQACRGEGTSRRAAEQAAAEHALQMLSST